MKTVRITLDPTRPKDMKTGRVDTERLDATTDADIAAHAAADDAQARQDAARFVRRVRRHLGLSQTAFSELINVPLETVRHWEEGTQSPTGAAKALVQILDRAPELALAALRAR